MLEENKMATVRFRHRGLAMVGVSLLAVTLTLYAILISAQGWHVSRLNIDVSTGENYYPGRHSLTHDGDPIPEPEPEPREPRLRVDRDPFEGLEEHPGRGRVFAAPAQTPCHPQTRAQAVRQVCESQGWADPTRLEKSSAFSHIYVDDFHKVLYCAIPKVACSSFKYLLAQQSPQFSRWAPDWVHSLVYMHSVGIKVLSEFSPDERQRRLRDYYKFMVVRHPLDRLQSTYESKFNNRFEKFFQGQFREIIKAKFGLTVRMESIHFDQFLDLVGHNTNDSFSNEHWHTYDRICHPCEISYDHVIRLETIASDKKEVLSKFSGHQGTPPDMPTKNLSSREKRSLAALGKEYAGVASDTKEAVYKMYAKDMQLFGYHWDGLNATCRYDWENPGMTCC